MYRGSPPDDDNVLHEFFPSGSSQSSRTCKPTRSMKIISIPPVPLASTVPRLQLRFFVIESAFVGTNAHVEAKTWLLCFGSSSRLLYKRVLVTQGVSYISPAVTLDKTPSTSKKKFSIGRLTSSISITKLMLTELQKSPTSFDSFEKDSSPGSDGTTSLKTRVGARQLGRIGQGNHQTPLLP